MRRLAERKTRLIFETAAKARYRGEDRPIIVEPRMSGHSLSVRLKGTRVAYEISWRWIFDRAAMLEADRNRGSKRERGKAGAA